ncbi:uncharacterized protein LOC124163797 [Ischnura elegans]|uniref:uncharacterized protein LOC124163797 n=1 Tax=Ischnura elegans TaxID=197161 RepID=UPI001ED89925|nr:uncharacterized protein LOC124163797 [Ischnura elegans]
MAKCVLNCVYAVAILLIVSAHDLKLGEERLSIHKVLEPKEGEELRVIYGLPSPLTKRSEINMSFSRSHWLIEKISVIKASGELHATCKNTTNPCNDVLAVCNNGTCLCPKYYKEKIGKCLAPHAMPCSPDDGCITANAMCMNGTESDGITRWTCQCKQGEDYIEADDECSGG